MGFFLSLALNRLLIAIMILWNYVLLIKYDFITINFFSHLRLIASRTLIGRMVKLAKAEAGAHQAVN